MRQYTITLVNLRVEHMMVSEKFLITHLLALAGEDDPVGPSAQLEDEIFFLFLWGPEARSKASTL